MGGEGSIAGMIISLRNNANIRLGRKKYFNKDNPYLTNQAKVKRVAKKVNRTPQQIEEFHIKEKARKRRELLIQVLAFVVSGLIAGFVLYLLFGTSLFTK